MPDIVVKYEEFGRVVKEVCDTIYRFGKSFVVDFCGFRFDLWDLFIGGLVLGVIAMIYWTFRE